MFPVPPALRCLSHPSTPLLQPATASLQHAGGGLQSARAHCTAHPRKRVVGKHGTEEVQNFPQRPATTRELPLVPPNGNRARRSAKAALGVAGGCFGPTFLRPMASLIFVVQFLRWLPPVRQRSVSTGTITTIQILIAPWWWCRPDCASQQVRCAFRRPTCGAGLPDTPHGTTPAYQAKDVPLLILGIGTSTAFARRVEAYLEDRATPVGALHRPPKPSRGGYWGSWPFGQIYEKCMLRNLGLLGERRMHTGV